MIEPLPTYFISHGGGPWPWMPNLRAMFSTLELSLKEMVESWPYKPKAILMISGHWEEDKVAVMASSQPPMVYDYYGFPDEAYEIDYPAKGAPELATQTLELLNAHGIEGYLDTKRGFDHGTFVPLEVMLPDASIPIIQVSLLKSYSPQMHIKIGNALASLREQGIMLIGSGLSYHNLGQLGKNAKTPSKAFDNWLYETLHQSPEIRKNRLLNWEEAPFARTCHPKEDHLLPLFVVLGAAEHAKATRIYHEESFMGGVTVSSYRFD